jgi:hypothetical protein
MPADQKSSQRKTMLGIFLVVVIAGIIVAIVLS